MTAILSSSAMPVNATNTKLPSSNDSGKASGGGSSLLGALEGLGQALKGLAEVLNGIADKVVGGGGKTCAKCGKQSVSDGANLIGSPVGGGANAAPKADAVPKPEPAANPEGGASKVATAPLKVKGKAINAEQRKNIDEVLTVGKEMGANRKVLESAVATMIQESNLENLNHGDRDSLGLFQQRPSMGWGTPAQVRDPKHAARKYFEQAIPADKKNPSASITKLAQTVQKSGFPDAYQQWAGEAKSAVDAFLGVSAA